MLLNSSNVFLASAFRMNGFLSFNSDWFSREKTASKLAIFMSFLPKNGCIFLNEK